MVDTSKPVDRTGNTFCGPLVLAAIVGTSTGEVCERIAAQRRENRGVLVMPICGKPKVKRVRARTAAEIRGTYDTELFAFLNAQGFRTESVDTGARYHRQFRRDTYVNESGSRFSRGGIPTFSADNWYPWTVLKRECPLLWQWLMRIDDDTYIVHLPHHWAIVSGQRWCETYTSGQWVDRRQAPMSNRHVVNAWRVVRPGESNV